MIHRIDVTPEISPAELAKLFRKKLMTGGAVIRIPAETSAENLSLLFEKYSSDVREHGLHALVLKEIAHHPNASTQLQEKLSALNIVKKKA